MDMEARRKVAKSDGIDRLSELPDSLILEILSLLKMRDVVRTTLLSKRWRDLWTTIPCLHFELAEADYNPSSEFPNFVSGALALWKGSKVQKFSLLCDRRYIRESWLLFAIEKQVEELKITVWPSREGGILEFEDYSIPSFLYLCSSVKKLTLNACRLEVKEEENVQWDQLLSLKVCTFGPGLCAKVVNRLLPGAPRLKILDLQVFGCCQELNIRSSSLKMLEIHLSPHIAIPMLRIWAPNLESLKLSGIAYTRCLLKVPSLTNVVLDFHGRDWILEEDFLRQFFVNIRHVEKITLSYMCIKALCGMMKRDTPTPLSDAKFLRLYPTSPNKVLDVLEMFPQLKTLVVERRYAIFERYTPIERRESSTMFEPPTNFQCSFLENLRDVKVIWLVPDSSIYPVLEILLKNARALQKMVFLPVLFKSEEEMITSISDFEAEEKKKVLSMHRSSPNAEVIINLWSSSNARKLVDQI